MRALSPLFPYQNSLSLSLSLRAAPLFELSGGRLPRILPMCHQCHSYAFPMPFLSVSGTFPKRFLAVFMQFQGLSYSFSFRGRTSASLQSSAQVLLSLSYPFPKRFLHVSYTFSKRFLSVS